MYADISDHFKPLKNKSEASCMRNIDFIYMINLDERPEKLATAMEKLAPYNIKPYRFSAVNGWNLSLEEVNDLGVQYETWMSDGRWATFYALDGDRTPEHEIVGIPGRTYFCHCMALGSMGCALSHASVMQDALDSGYQTIWIVEDDIEVVQDPHLLSDLIDELDAAVGKDGWDVLFTDQDTKNTDGKYVPCSSYAWRPNYTPTNTDRFAERRDVSPQIRQIGSRYGSYSMILRRSGIKKILTFLKCYQIFLPYDMEYTQPATIRLFAVKNDVVSTQPRASSDNGAPNYSINPKGWQND
ncbi:MAG TPA: glycosyltransferase family 25 protein [Chlamydiales bacterium]|nr:glycosyltransferase family 25 protein [Chlamydiales bacterium]